MTKVENNNTSLIRFILIYIALNFVSFFFMYFDEHKAVIFSFMFIEHIALLYFLVRYSFQKSEEDIINKEIRNLSLTNSTIERVDAGARLEKNLVIQSFNKFIGVLFLRFRLLKLEIKRLSLLYKDFSKLLDLMENEVNESKNENFKINSQLELFKINEERINIIANQINSNAKRFIDAEISSIDTHNFKESLNYLDKINNSRLSVIVNTEHQFNFIKDEIDKTNSSLDNIIQNSKIISKQLDLMEEFYIDFDKVVEDMHLLSANIAIESAKIGINSFTMISEKARNQVNYLNQIKDGFHSTLYTLRLANKENYGFNNILLNKISNVSEKINSSNDSLLKFKDIYREEKNVLDNINIMHVNWLEKQFKITNFLKSIYADTDFFKISIEDLKKVENEVIKLNKKVLNNINKKHDLIFKMKDLSSELNSEWLILNNVMQMLNYTDKNEDKEYFRQEQRIETPYKIYVYNKANNIKLGFIGDYSFKGLSFVTSIVFLMNQEIDCYLQIPAMSDNMKDETVSVKIKIISINYYYDMLDSDGNVLFRYGCEVYYLNQEGEMIMYRIING